MILGPRNQVDEAIEHLRRVVEINPLNAEAYRNLAFAYGLRGRNDEAAAARDQLQRLLAARR
jgi:Flp pilus assembly protein TadD